MSEQPGSNGTSRLDRMEVLMELLIEDHLKFRDEHRQLLTAQVLLTDHVDQIARSIRELAEAQKHTDDRLNALINVVDDIARKRPNA